MKGYKIFCYLKKDLFRLGSLFQKEFFLFKIFITTYLQEVAYKNDVASFGGFKTGLRILGGGLC